LVVRAGFFLPLSKPCRISAALTAHARRAGFDLAPPWGQVAEFLDPASRLLKVSLHICAAGVEKS
jgi:hypothetical protein